MRRWLLVVLVIAAGCRTTARPPGLAPGPQPPGSLPSTSPAQPGPTPGLPDGVHWVRNAAEYRAAAVQAYRVATLRVEAAAAGREAGAWAVILDADETVLDNSIYQKELAERGARFDPDTWDAWCRRRAAGAVPGSARFLRRVRELGGRIAIVTNRGAAVCPDTEAVFERLGLVYDVMLCKPRGAGSDKQDRFRAVERGQASPELPPLEVVLWVGDNIRDFPGLGQDLRRAPIEAFEEFGNRFVVVPNPMYGSWQGNPQQ